MRSKGMAIDPAVHGVNVAGETGEERLELFNSPATTGKIYGGHF